MSLTAKQQAYAEARISGLEPSAAYRVAYAADNMTPKAISVEAARLEKHPSVSLAITSAQSRVLQKVEQRTAVSVSRVVEEYARIAFADMRRFASVGPGGVSLVSSDEWTDDDAAAVAEVSESTSKEGGSIRFKLHNKVSALDSIAKHLGMFVERHEVDVTVRSEALLAVAQMTPEQLRELAAGARRD